MSFASETKNELARITPEKKCCTIAEIAGFIRFAGSIGLAGGGKFRISMKSPDGGDPYFIPGYGKNDTNGWGGTVNLVFDVGQNLMKKKQSGENK